MWKLFHQKKGTPLLVSEEDFNKVRDKKKCYLDSNTWGKEDVIGKRKNALQEMIKRKTAQRKAAQTKK